MIGANGAPKEKIYSNNKLKATRDVADGYPLTS